METSSESVVGEEVVGLTVGVPSVQQQQQDVNDENDDSLMMAPLVDLEEASNSNSNSEQVRSRKIASPTVQSSGERRERRRRHVCKYTNVLARILFWASLFALAAGVVWYSLELTKHGTDPHLIAWFSAGAFVLLGFPISMYGIVMHLANYNQPNVQCYVVRILWMVPIYSIESWLCLRFHQHAMYIETLRDLYESYVLYCFLQFLISVLGGEEELVGMLRTKSPTRGVHMWGLQWCVRPWLMGQPITRTIGKVHWTSPFFVKCKFGVLQYVLLKFVSSIFVMILELTGNYKEGDFTPTGGYLYICILTNLSQCWALYCMIFFYYATKNELGPIRPVGKFLSVKALVFFTWWQSVGISLLYQMDMIPHYHAKEEWTSEDVAKGLQDYLICIEMFLFAIVHVFVFPHTDYLASPVKNRVLRHTQKRLGRKYPWRDDQSCKNSVDLELSSKPTDDDETMDDSSLGFVESPVGFVHALLDSTIPRDVIDSSAGILKGDYHVEKKTLLHHATTSDQYDLFRLSRFHPKPSSL